MAGKRHLVVGILVCLLLGTATAFIYGADVTAGPTSQWQEGDWWITETHVLFDTSGNVSGPSALTDNLLYHKWTVARREQLDGLSCWVIDISACKLPKEIKNDHGDAALVTLYIAEESRTLRRVSFALRTGNYLVAGTKIRKGVVAYKQDKPVDVSWCMLSCPLDVPMLPKSWHETGLREGNKQLEYEAERSGKPWIQRVEPFLQLRDGRRVPTMLVTLRRSDGDLVRTTLWSLECPWWLEWRQLKKGYPVEMWYARTIDWKGKKN